MSKPYHLMTNSEKITARIASNKAIEEKVAQGQASGPAVTEFARLGHAFLESLPDIDKGTEAARLLKLGQMAKSRKK